MRVSVVITAIFCLLTVLCLGACDSEECLQCVDCPDFTGDYVTMWSTTEDTCDGTAFSVGTTEIPAMTGGQLDLYLSDQGLENIHMRIIQDEIMAELDGVLCVPEESGGFSINLSGGDNSSSEVSVSYSFSGAMVNVAEQEPTDGGTADASNLPADYQLQGYFTAEYINNSDLNDSCRVAGELESFSY